MKEFVEKITDYVAERLCDYEEKFAYTFPRFLFSAFLQFLPDSDIPQQVAPLISDEDIIKNWYMIKQLNNYQMITTTMIENFDRLKQQMILRVALDNADIIARKYLQKGGVCQKGNCYPLYVEAAEESFRTAINDWWANLDSSFKFAVQSIPNFGQEILTQTIKIK